MTNAKSKGKLSPRNLLLMSIAAVGVVFGDIGTSPLYAINEIFFGHADLPHNTNTILGTISLVIWVLTIVISIKYVIFVLRTNNQGEGGTFALLGLLKKIETRSAKLMTGILVLAAGLLFGEGIITPAISVLSAVEGLKVATTFFEPYILPITIAILTGLFFIQSRGTDKIGKLFGPIIIVWFTTITIFGLMSIFQNPIILKAFNPIYAFQLLFSLSITRILLVLSSVILVITGGEALFADMGHFGVAPIRVSWYSLVYPALITQYLGQGAYLLSGKTVLNENIFYSMVPQALLYPTVILATFATVIASQALITGSFSLVKQGIALSLIPHLKIDHTHQEHEGQIYIGFVNMALYVGCIALVLTFKSSTNLAAAYGLAVSGVMLTTSLSMAIIAVNSWKWSHIKTFMIFGVFAMVDLVFLASNSLKFLNGGYIPLTLGLILFGIMSTWNWGRKITIDAYNKVATLKIKEFIPLLNSPINIFEKPTVIFSRKPIKDENDHIPRTLQIFWDKFRAAPKYLIILTIKVDQKPYMSKEKRFEIHEFEAKEYGGLFMSVIAHYGFMETVQMVDTLQELIDSKLVPHEAPFSKWIIQAGQERLIISDNMKFFRKLRFKCYIMMKNITTPAFHHMGLGKNNQLFIEAFPEIVE